jgi:hypothetical protein
VLEAATFKPADVETDILLSSVLHGNILLSSILHGTILLSSILHGNVVKLVDAEPVSILKLKAGVKTCTSPAAASRSGGVGGKLLVLRSPQLASLSF